VQNADVVLGPGSYNIVPPYTAPPFVSAICVGGGGSGASVNGGGGGGGGGGGLAWVNNISIVPGVTLLRVTVGKPTSPSSILIGRTTVLKVNGGSSASGQFGGTGGCNITGFGGCGGAGGTLTDNAVFYGAGGGGAGGYFGNGGNGGNASGYTVLLNGAGGPTPGLNAAAGSGAGGGGGGGGSLNADSDISQPGAGGYGGGVGLYGLGTDGVGGLAGFDASGTNGTAGSNFTGVTFGAGAGSSMNGTVFVGAPGACRIVWGVNIGFPNSGVGVPPPLASPPPPPSVRILNSVRAACAAN